MDEFNRLNTNGDNFLTRDELEGTTPVDGEIVCVDDDGRPNFHKLLFRRDGPFFYAFDLIELNGADLHPAPLIARRRLLHGIIPAAESRVRYVEHVDEQGRDFHRVARECDLEASWVDGDVAPKNPDYSQADLQPGPT